MASLLWSPVCGEPSPAGRKPTHQELVSARFWESPQPRAGRPSDCPHIFPTGKPTQGEEVPSFLATGVQQTAPHTEPISERDLQN